MAKKKSPPVGQFSLFDIIIDNIETLKKENEMDEQKTRSILYGNRSTITSGSNSKETSFTGNNQPSIQDRGTNNLHLKNFRSLGIEQPREVEGVGERGLISISNSPSRANEIGERRDGNGTILRPISYGNEPLGDIPKNEHQHRTLTNYVITNSDNIGIGTPKQKYQDNINAIKIVLQLRSEQRKYATEEEQKVLVKYVGWGGLPQAFDENNEQWQNEYKELKALLTEEDYNNARRSTQDAHFTPKNVIDTIYQGLKYLGVNSEVDILEPAAGIGNFIGYKPQEFNANYFTVEKDNISADILSYLYPNEKHLHKGFQETNLTMPTFNITIGNPPFGQLKLYDKNFPQLDYSIHNYFIAKSMELVKEGGIGAFVVSRYFMDSVSNEHRQHIAENSHFLGAIRLPNTVFKQNALTEVTTDIVFFQKKTQQEKYNNITKGYNNWVNLSETSIYNKNLGNYEQGAINQYFVDNPHQILGKLEYGHGRFDTELNCINPQIDISHELSKALTVLPRNIFDNSRVQHSTIKQKLNPIENRILSSDYYKKLKEGSLFENVGKQQIFVKMQNQFNENNFIEYPLKNNTAFHRIKGMIQIRDTLRTLINIEKSENPDLTVMERKRKELNIQYDNFVKKYGYLNSQVNRSLFNSDPEATLLQSIEFKYDKGISKEIAKKTGKEPKEASAVKAPIFKHRVLQPVEKATKAETSKEALLISLRETGNIDFSRMESLVSKSQEEIKKELNGTLIFENPVTKEWEVADKYLTGNVRKKLQEAQKFAHENSAYQFNVEALKNVMPADIEPADIGVRFGSTWIPPKDIKTFLEEKISKFMLNKDTLDYIPSIGQWNVSLDFASNTANTEIWGTPDYPANKLVKSLLENTPIRVMKNTDQVDERGNPIRELDQEATSAAMQKAEAIQQEFKDWIWDNDERRERLAKVYNEKFNTNIPVNYDGSHIELPGASIGVSLRPHQKNVIWRSVQEGTALFDHVVGAGKTLATVATIKESKRMGFIKKPMVVVPNHLVYQWRDEFYKLYPDANILVADKVDFLKENRERFFGRIATGEWDAVIIPHSSFKKIDMPKDFQEQILQEQINAVENSLTTLYSSDDSNKATIKQLERQKERMQERIMKLLDSVGTKGKNIDFSDMGVDALFVDEAHEFKNLGFSTSLSVSGLGNVQGSAKALDLYIKCRYLQKQNNGKGVFFLTGTPISNTIAEVYTMQRYLQYDALRDKEIEHFDAWASTFGRISSNWELDATGVNYKLKSRFANFDNVPELLAMYRTFADVVTKSDIDEQTKKQGLPSLTPPILNDKPINIVVERSPQQAEYMEEIIERMESLPRKKPTEDNALKITNDARKAGLDYRLIDPTAEDFENSKVNVCANKIVEIWEQSKEDKGTQLVFCDLSTPKGLSNTLTIKETHSDSDDEDLENDTDTISMDELLSINSNFSVYNDLKEKLIKKGIPEEQIAFIHSANNDMKKAKLFSDVNNGDVRVLIGSTSKMGAGMNVQERLVAAHHLDAPWRPSDLEQRNGRIIRQGNKLYENNPDFKIQIYNYATKQTYDARMWQTIEYKASAIEQFRKGDVLQRSIEDVQSEAANAAEMKAAASGNPLILLEVTYNTEKRKLEALYNQHQKAQHRLDSKIKYLSKADERLAIEKQKYDIACSVRDKNSAKENYFITNEGYKLIHKEELQKSFSALVVNSAKEVLRSIKAEPCIGKYRGFDVSIHHSASSGDERYYKYVLSTPDGTKYQADNLVYEIGRDFKISLLFNRFDELLDNKIGKDYENQKIIHANEKKEIIKAQEAQGTPFKFMDELQVVRQNHSAILRELGYMQKNTEYVSNFVPLTVEKYREQKTMEQKQQNTIVKPKGLSL